METRERYSRQASLVPANKLADVRATVVGTGAIGRQVAMQLAAIGTPWIQLIDFDTVEEGNLAAQGFMEEDLGKPKVEAVGQICAKINSEGEIQSINDRFRAGMPIGNVVFSCVDDISVRELMFKAVKDEIDLFIDGRMAAEAFQVITAWDKDSKKHYLTTLFTPEEAYQGSCTAKTTIYSSNIVAGMMVSQLAKYLREFSIYKEIQYNLLTHEIEVI